MPDSWLHAVVLGDGVTGSPIHPLFISVHTWLHANQSSSCVLLLWLRRPVRLLFARDTCVVVAQDVTFIIASRLFTIPFLYSLVWFTWTSPGIDWGFGTLNAMNTIVPFALLFVVYDFVYTLFHRALHIRALYPLVHKHHHRQHSPFRGNIDAINVHPFEYITGEFLHLGAAWFLIAIGLRIHALTILMFMIVGGILASLNHTRHDVRIPPSVYDVR